MVDMSYSVLMDEKGRIGVSTNAGKFIHSITVPMRDNYLFFFGSSIRAIMRYETDLCFWYDGCDDGGRWSTDHKDFAYRYFMGEEDAPLTYVTSIPSLVRNLSSEFNYPIQCPMHMERELDKFVEEYLSYDL